MNNSEISDCKTQTWRDLVLIWDMAESKSHSYWYFYTLVVLGILGFLLTTATEFSLRDRMVIVAWFLAFSQINCWMNYQACRLLESVQSAIAGFDFQPPNDLPNNLVLQKVNADLASSIGTHRKVWTLAVYFFTGTTLSAVILFQ